MDPITQAYLQLLLQNNNPLSGLGQMGGMPPMNNPMDMLGMDMMQQIEPQGMPMGPQIGSPIQPQQIEPYEPQYSQNRTQANLYAQGGSAPPINDPMMGPPPGPPPSMSAPPQDPMGMQMQQQQMPGAQGQYQELLAGSPMNMMGDALSQNFNMQNEMKGQMMDTISNYQPMM